MLGPEQTGHVLPRASVLLTSSQGSPALLSLPTSVPSRQFFMQMREPVTCWQVSTGTFLWLCLLLRYRDDIKFL